MSLRKGGGRGGGSGFRFGTPRVSVADNAARNTYFTTNPGELTQYDEDPFLVIAVGTGYQYRTNDAWADVAVVLVGERGLPGTNAPRVETEYSINGVDYTDDPSLTDPTTHIRVSVDGGSTFVVFILDSPVDGIDGLPGTNAPQLQVQYSVDGTNYTDDPSTTLPTTHVRVSVDNGANFAVFIMPAGPAAPNTIIQGSVNGLSSWHTPPVAADVFVRFSVDGGTSYTDAVRLRGSGSLEYQYSPDTAESNFHAPPYDADTDFYIRFRELDSSDWSIAVAIEAGDGDSVVTGTGDPDDIIEVYARFPVGTVPSQAAGTLAGTSLTDYTPTPPWGIEIPDGTDPLWVQVIFLTYPGSAATRGLYNISGLTEAEVDALLADYRTATQITNEITAAVTTGLGAARVRSTFIAQSAVLDVLPLTGVLPSIDWTLQSGTPAGFDANGGRIFVPPLAPGSPNNSVNGFIGVMTVDGVDVDEVFIPWGVASTHSSQAVNSFSLLADPATENNLDIRYDFEGSVGYVLTLIGNGSPLSPNTRVRIYLAQAGSGNSTGDDSPFRGSYNSTTVYDIGQYVNLGSRLFFSLTTNNQGNQPASDDGTNWHELESDTNPYQGVYAELTTYGIGDYVNEGADLYFSLVDGNQGNHPAADNGTNWRLLSVDTNPFRGTYNDTTTYGIGNYVSEGADLYFSLVNNNVGNDPASDDGTNWRELVVDTNPFYETWENTREYTIGNYVNIGTRIFFSIVVGNLGNDPETDDGTNWIEVGRAEEIIHVYNISNTPYEIGHIVFVMEDRVFYYVRANTQQTTQIPRDNPADFTPTFAAGVADLVPSSINGVTFDVLQGQNETILDTAQIGDEDYLVGLGDGTFRVEAATLVLHIPSQSFNGNFWAIKQIEAPLLGIRAGIQILINGANPQYIWESAVIDLSGGMGQIFNLNVDRVGDSIFNLVLGDIISFRRWHTAPNPGDILISFPVSDPIRRTLPLTFDATNPATNPYWDIERGVAGFRLPDGTFIPVIDLDGLPDENSALEAFIHGFAHSVRFIFANFESESAITDPTGTYDHETITLTLDPPYTDDESTLNDDGLRVTRLAILKRNDTLLFSNYVVTSNSDEVHHAELSTDLAQRFVAPGFALDLVP